MNHQKKKTPVPMILQVVVVVVVQTWVVQHLESELTVAHT
jgi:hypothetical protein